ncbi:MAG TPA: hypothetical protein VHC22_03240 [Pirellulales bacterium]|nr:hypothetical protein [Pirellulales bacterium]
MAALACLALSCWHWIETYGNRIEVIEAVAGKPISVKGRYIRVFGAPQCELAMAGHPAAYDAA